MRATTRYLFYKSLWALLCPVVYFLMLMAIAIFVLMFAALSDNEFLAFFICTLVVLALCALFYGYFFHLLKKLRGMEVPTRSGLRLLPWFVPLFYTLSLSLAAYGLASRVGMSAFALPTITIPWNWFFILAPLFGGWNAGLIVCVPLVPAVIKVFIGIGLEIKNTPFSEWRGPLALLATPALAMSATLIWAHQDLGTKILSKDFNVAIVFEEMNQRVVAIYMEHPEQAARYASSDETDLTPFIPFTPSNNLVKIESPGLTIDSDHPILHGALALFPVYAAAVEATYHDVWKNVGLHHLVKGGTSPEAFAALLDGEADILFMGAPSGKQLAEAKARGKELTVTPLGYEAFVFFVSRVNTVDNLTDAQIRDIYSRKITRWRSVDGDNQRILPFQRPEGSGSQTAMERVMDGVPLAKPVREEYQQLMGGIVNRVADYRNYGNAIGYSFRYYVESMFKHDGVKIISVNGVAPTLKNIQSGAYPFVYPLVAMTAGTQNPNAQKLLDWFLSPQGQDLIRRTGYVPLD